MIKDRESRISEMEKLVAQKKQQRDREMARARTLEQDQIP
jgi:hypothetical protein